MKKFSLGIFLILFTAMSSAHSQAELKDTGPFSNIIEQKKAEYNQIREFVIHEGINRLGMFNLLDLRCRAASGPHKELCAGAAARAVNIFDFRNPIAFARQTLKLATLPEATRYLRAIGKGEYRALGLWEFSVKFHWGDRERALQWIATLLQDTHSLSLEAILGPNGPSYQLEIPVVSEEFIAELKAANRAINEEHDPGLLYPAEVGSQSGNWVNSQYHFYVIAYWAYKLRKSGVPASFSGLLPYLFNQTYELGHANIGEDWLQGFSEATLGPRPFQKTSRGLDFWMDSYSGYTGARWGAALMDPAATREIPSIRFFQDAYSAGAHEVYSSFF